MSRKRFNNKTHHENGQFNLQLSVRLKAGRCMTSTQLELETTTLSEKIHCKLLRYKLHKKENTMRKVGY